jgi:hypothetical protein
VIWYLQTHHEPCSISPFDSNQRSWVRDDPPPTHCA